MNFLRGRTNRATYWLMIAVIAVVIAVLDLTTRKNNSLSEAVLVAVAAPRLHDIGRSGWWACVGLGIEALGLIISSTLLGAHMAAGMGVTVLVIAGLMVWLGCVRGESSPNRFGEPPMGGVPFKRNARVA